MPCQQIPDSGPPALYRPAVLAISILAHALLTPAQALPASINSNLQDRTTADQRAPELNAGRERKKAENKEFLNRFRSLPPEERVNIWKQANDEKYSHSVAFRIANEIQDLLVIEGTDTVPQLAAIVRDRHEPYFYRFWAAKILADMDRYVPAADLPKGAVATLAIDELNLRGATNPFLQVTGRRIGDEGRKSLEWAASAGDDKWLQFFTRDALGLVKQELEGLTIDEQVRRWRDLAAQTKGAEGRPESFLRDTLGRLIVERAPDSLSALRNLLNNDRDRYVRTAVVGLIRGVDAYRFRLRKTDLGRSTIEDIHKAVIRGEVKVQCPQCDTSAATWAELSDQFNNDNFGLNPGTIGAYYAQMLHVLYSENTTKVVQVGKSMRQEWAIPEFTAFITFLTDQDPFFPSWEYTYFGPPYSEAFHPQFAAKMARIEDAWKLYQTNRMAASAP
ncbi:MAG TPA: hypothetical protein VJN89_20945 [Candidatus Acidoferrum sp.]|nr:hypothetical protein [Candidatus Acidoferrum sp.]